MAAPKSVREPEFEAFREEILGRLERLETVVSGLAAGGTATVSVDGEAPYQRFVESVIASALAKQGPGILAHRLGGRRPVIGTVRDAVNALHDALNEVNGVGA